MGALCDVYTYTTLISQCGSHQQLRKALELVAEMRSRGIACNVHTYSALMNVCIKVRARGHVQERGGVLQLEEGRKAGRCRRLGQAWSALNVPGGEGGRREVVLGHAHA